MWNAAEQRYRIFEIELAGPLPEIAVPADCSGMAAVIRLRGTPVGFFMEAMHGPVTLDSSELAARILRHSGKQIISERIYREMRPSAPPAGSPEIDIAICTHNRPDALAACLKSLFEAGGIDGPVRVLVIDNAPPDGRTRDVVAAFPGVRYLVEPKPGLDFARNRAVDEAQGELLAFLDDDVAIDRAWLEGLREAWGANPDAGAFLGPILPMELETRAQIVFERMGGFGKSLERVRYGSTLPDVETYPVGAGIFGAGANMVFRLDVLRKLGGFDDALDTGAPLPGGGDLDMFYRVAGAGYALVREPKMLVFHQHRREYRNLRRQMWTWGLGAMAYITKSWRAEPEQRPKIRRWVLWWLVYQTGKLFAPLLRRSAKRWPWDMVLAEIAGGIVGLCGEYDRSLRRVERLRRRFA
jgi:GT2 family glycosyltransferase